MRVLFCCTGGAGHLLPLRPLAQALRARGHAVAWVTAPDALHFLAGQGFEQFMAGPTFDDSRGQFRSAFAEAAGLQGEPLSAFTFPRLFGAILAPAMLQGVDDAVRRWRPDFVVHEPAALAAPLICEQRGLRHIVHGYGLRPPVEYLAAAMQWFGPHWCRRGLRAPADGGVFRHRCLNIAPASLEPSALSPGGRCWRFNPYRPAGPSVVALPDELRHLARPPSTSGPRVYLTFGTVFNRSAALVAAAQAAARLGGALVITVGVNGEPERLAGLAGRSQVLRFVDQRALMPHCDLVVSHGGAGTVLGAAAHGLPQLVLPQAADHFRNARALDAAGAGVVVEADRQTTDILESTMRAMLSNTTLAERARRLAAEMAALPDADAAALELEQWHASSDAR